MSSRRGAAGSASFIRCSPTRKASNPAFRRRSRSACVRNPDSLTAMHSSGIASISSSEISVRTLNNRNLRDFKVRTEISLELIEAIPEECIAVSESGLRTHADLDRLRNAGFDAFLVGEHLMKEADPAAPLRELIGLTGDGDTNHAG